MTELTGAISMTINSIVNDQLDIREQIQDHIDSIDHIDFDNAEEALDYMDSFHGLVMSYYVLEQQLLNIQFPSGSNYDL